MPLIISGAIGAIRTRDLPLRRRTLYPTELQPQRTPYILAKTAVLFKGNLAAPLPRQERMTRLITNARETSHMIQLTSLYLPTAVFMNA